MVGPESAGSYPGPICYKNDGVLAVTDANLCLGRIIPKYFPKIFGRTKSEELDRNLVLDEFNFLASQINEFCRQNSQNEMSIEEIALGFLKVANESMCRPIRSLTQGKGYEPSSHVLACFGGAGGQHACAIARSLGIKQVFIHKYSGILSAYGMALADVVHEETIPCSLVLIDDNLAKINTTIDDLVKKCRSELINKKFDDSTIKFEVFLNLRFEKTDFCLMIKNSGDDYHCTSDNYRTSFWNQYSQEFGFVTKDKSILIDDIRVRGIGFTTHSFESSSALSSKTEKPLIIRDMASIFFETGNWCKTPVYFFEDLEYGHEINGPGMIIETNTTILIEPFCKASITHQGNILIDIQDISLPAVSIQQDSVLLSIFSHMFMSIAEQMGTVLQKTSISTNIKERLDFSCAIFGPDGHLVR